MIVTIEAVYDKPEKWVAYFGYGSLVNDKTRNAESFGLPVRLRGYRRHWSVWEASPERKALGLMGAVALSVTANANAFCDGLLIFDHKDHLPQVDLREAHYTRTPIDYGDMTGTQPLPEGLDCYIYVGQPPLMNRADARYPILQSYIDAVMQGFLHKFGQEGVKRFVEETDGWHIPVLGDRMRPIYPRHVSLTDAEMELVDQYVTASGAPKVTLQQLSPDVG
ncbi:gamma-glutamylcyclotransferase family protein [uncultured Cohaesibacter sp.]|uniref:gamma-glutamylcyclotransferase family protein n=1 Tax=uncultured Cohaesibacter sp. TaxID=1002546 RepID=UPI0029C867C9|nr:gamma-glutamylcyclotransferase family protein [uncultured Cohaesibacter sp.]